MIALVILSTVVALSNAEWPHNEYYFEWEGPDRVYPLTQMTIDYITEKRAAAATPLGPLDLDHILQGVAWTSIGDLDTSYNGQVCGTSVCDVGIGPQMWHGYYPTTGVGYPSCCIIGPTDLPTDSHDCVENVAANVAPYIDHISNSNFAADWVGVTVQQIIHRGLPDDTNFPLQCDPTELTKYNINTVLDSMHTLGDLDVLIDGTATAWGLNVWGSSISIFYITPADYAGGVKPPAPPITPGLALATPKPEQGTECGNTGWMISDVELLFVEEINRVRVAGGDGELLAIPLSAALEEVAGLHAQDIYRNYAPGCELEYYQWSDNVDQAEVLVTWTPCCAADKECERNKAEEIVGLDWVGIHIYPHVTISERNVLTEADVKALVDNISNGEDPDAIFSVKTKQMGVSIRGNVATIYRALGVVDDICEGELGETTTEMEGETVDETTVDETTVEETTTTTSNAVASSQLILIVVAVVAAVM